MVLIFWTKFAKKGYFLSNIEKVNITIDVYLEGKFHLKQTILSFLAKFKIFFYHKYVKMFVHMFHSLKEIFENSTTVKMTHLNISVAVNVVEMTRRQKDQEFINRNI